jgi:uncharacterized protein YecT (DUF1311 family)
MMRLFAAAALLCLFESPALADSACNHPHDDFDGLYCLNKVYQQADADLNTAFGQLRGKLDEAGRAALKSGQLSWIRSRNEECSKREASGFYVNLQCATKSTKLRTQFLQDRVRECISSGCMNSRLD